KEAVCDDGERGAGTAASLRIVGWAVEKLRIAIGGAGCGIGNVRGVRLSGGVVVVARFESSGHQAPVNPKKRADSQSDPRAQRGNEGRDEVAGRAEAVAAAEALDHRAAE